MNILSLVFAILLILGLFTHYQLESFKQFAAIRSEYNDYIKHHEREYFNLRQEALYTGMEDSAPQSDVKKKPRSSRVSAPRINFRLIIDQEARKANQDKAEQHQFLAKELMLVLFQQTEEFQKLAENRPNFLDELFDQLIAVSSEKKIKFIEDIDKLNLEDEELQRIFYQMLRGIPKKVEEIDKTPQLLISTDGDTEETDEEEEVVEEEDFKSEKDSISFKDFIHFRPKQQQIKIYLAPQELLLSIFGDPEIVKQIINTREDIYLKIKKLGPDIGKQKLEEYRNRKRPEIKDDLLDFSVSKTDPRKYR